MSRTVKKLLNSAEHLRSELIQGLCFANNGRISSLEEYSSVYQDVSSTRPVIISGGGSGHEPTFAGFVGKGGIDGCAVGEVFSSPSPDQVIGVSQKLNKGEGVLFIIGNYAGDSMNFEIAAELLQEEGISVLTIKGTDDIASAPPSDVESRRGVAGIMYLYKLAGAAANYKNMALDELYSMLQRVNTRIKTIGVALDGCALPHTEKLNFSLAEDELELGIGIHGEAGLCRTKIKSADEVVEDMVHRLCEELILSSDEKLIVTVNNMGGLSMAELFIITRKVALCCQERNMPVLDINVGHFCSSLDMPGFSITFFAADEVSQELYSYPIDTLAWSKGE
ncbi:dihydroxyacetone kinase subunit DhaK [Klebsiella quasipneumoniae]|uniref:dihydroxyacetone kinase subunit DhaK n=1 Tax=Klebsiella quasipneumoniae TaxID=1463165 RepID=UPI000CEC9D60|nr:dihydroxyacetone kinase subunit DhaK [Klebsiella quasipneumoniae]ROC60481.1 dihydroxyacetone kinase subunit DhaK [Klebsiella quasipneumoniae subsp. quasipneumoniae]